MTWHLHELAGCSPTPLAHYLKALGILRLVGEQADPSARGFWRGETFCLASSLSREDLEVFFLEQYQPTPLVSPWNKGSGFFKENDPALAPLEQSSASRFQRFRDGITAARQLIDEQKRADAIIRAIKDRTKPNKFFQWEEQRELIAGSDIYLSLVAQLRNRAGNAQLSEADRGIAGVELATIESIVAPVETPPTRSEAKSLMRTAGYKNLIKGAERRYKTLKASLLRECYRCWRGPHAEWLAGAVVLNPEGEASWPSLLGTGGSDGRLDFTNNFMGRLGDLFDLSTSDGTPKDGTHELLRNCLWTAPSNRLASSSIGQFHPGSAGGANSSTGFEDGNLVNAWDYILMLEGTVLFSTRATRRLDPDASGRASAPFAVRAQGAGYASVGKEKDQRGEQWMPLWSRPSTIHELRTLLSEGRIQLDRDLAFRPVDVVRAIGRLGVARGIDAFVRYGFLERNGQSKFAVPLGRIDVRAHPYVSLVDDLAGWMDRLNHRARDSHASARLIHAERRLADAVFSALTHDHSCELWQDILRAAVEIESIQASGTAFEVGPIPPLRPEWLRVIDDGSVEFRLAIALGSAAAGYSKPKEGSGPRPHDSIRYHWLPLDEKKFGRQYKVSDKRIVNDPRVVASGRDPIADLAAIVDRRLMEAARKGQRCLPLVAVPRGAASLEDLATLLAGEVDLPRVTELARALMALRWDQADLSVHSRRPRASNRLPAEAWLAIRLSLLPWAIPDIGPIPADASMVRRLLAGDSASAVDLAIGRLRSVGVRVPLQSGVTDPHSARIWAAALAFPIDKAATRRAVEILDPKMKGKVHV